ncbi:MAG TPA: hypothetical protein VK176_00745 [Phycisphaerales bacterium]|nr:hypothetical protein [Phycisphaerales bacterium]
MYVPGLGRSRASFLALAAGVLLIAAPLPAAADPLGPDFSGPQPPGAAAPAPADPNIEALPPAASPAPVGPTRAVESRPLGKPRLPAHNDAHDQASHAGAPPSSGQPTPTPTTPRATGSMLESLDIGRTLAALAAVVALAFLTSAAVKAAARRKGGVALALGPAGRAPSGVVLVLARYPVQRGQTLVLLKVGPRIILTCQSRPSRFTAASMSTLCEFTEPDQVAELVRLTANPADASATRPGGFEAILRQVGLAKPEVAEQIAPQRRAAAEERMHMQPRQEQRILAAESGDRAEISPRADLLTRRPPAGFAPAAPRASTPSDRSINPPAHASTSAALRADVRRHATPTSTPASTPAARGAHIDGAEQLRRRLANLRAGGNQDQG